MTNPLTPCYQFPGHSVVEKWCNFD
jgi:hypothetical protein